MARPDGPASLWPWKERKMNDTEAIEIVDANLFASWKILASAPGVRLHDGPDMLRFLSGVEHPLCNGIMRLNLEAGEARERMAGALEVFRERKLPALCWVTPTCNPPDIASVVEAEGLESVEEATGMVLELSSLTGGVDVPAGMEIQVVTDEQRLSSWMDVFCEAYELPLEVRDFCTAAMTHAGLGGAAPFSHYVVYLDGSPVACSTTLVLEDVVGLYNVGTLPSARGRGAGTVSSLAPLEEARRTGCSIAVLQSTEMGKPVYSRLGFVKVSTLNAYLLAP